MVKLVKSKDLITQKEIIAILKQLKEQVKRDLGKDKNLSKDVITKGKKVVDLTKIKSRKKLKEVLKLWKQGKIDILGVDSGVDSIFPDIYFAYLKKMEKQGNFNRVKKPKI